MPCSRTDKLGRRAILSPPRLYEGEDSSYVRATACTQMDFVTAIVGPTRVGQSMAYRKHDDNVCFAFDDHGQIVPDFEPFESFMNEDVLDLRGRDEACCRGAKVCRRRGRGLNTQGPKDEERFFFFGVRQA